MWGSEEQYKPRDFTILTRDNKEQIITTRITDPIQTLTKGHIKQISREQVVEKCIRK